MTLRREIADAVALTRPAQWPILTAQLMMGVLLVSPRALGGGCWLNPWSAVVLLAGWASWVLLLNGGTLAFNSAFDRDDGPVAYLAAPPTPPRWLAGASLVAMLCGAVLAGVVVGVAFAVVVGVCVILSVLYSHPWARLKSKPGLDLLINMVGYGAGTTLAGLLAGRAAHLPRLGGSCPTGFSPAAFADVPEFPAAVGSVSAQFSEALSGGAGWLVLGFGLLFGSFYPLTQLYQIDEDRRRGDRTLAAALGHRHALLLALGLGLAAAVAFGLALGHRTGNLLWPLAAVSMAAWLIHLVRWFRRADRLGTAEHERGMYRALGLWAAVDGGLLLAWLF